MARVCANRGGVATRAGGTPQVYMWAPQSLV